jgi:hypothetical protein
MEKSNQLRKEKKERNDFLLKKINKKMETRKEDSREI